MGHLNMCWKGSDGCCLGLQWSYLHSHGHLAPGKGEIKVARSQSRAKEIPRASPYKTAKLNE